MSKIDVAAERKDQIVRATVECITKYGYHNFSMQDVARTAGVSKGIIHYYFLNKDELMQVFKTMLTFEQTVKIITAVTGFNYDGELGDFYIWTKR